MDDDEWKEGKEGACPMVYLLVFSVGFFFLGMAWAWAWRAILLITFHITAYYYLAVFPDAWRNELNGKESQCRFFFSAI